MSKITEKRGGLCVFSLSFFSLCRNYRKTMTTVCVKSNELSSVLTKVNASVAVVHTLWRQTLSWRWFTGKMIFTRSSFSAEGYLQFTCSLALSAIEMILRLSESVLSLVFGNTLWVWRLCEVLCGAEEHKLETCQWATKFTARCMELMKPHWKDPVLQIHWNQDAWDFLCLYKIKGPLISWNCS